MKTVVVNEKSIKRGWVVVDAGTLTLGRLASKVARLLTGKGKVAYSPNQDHGDYVIVINADQARLTGTKPQVKQYFRHSTYPGGGKFRSFSEQMTKDSTKVIRHAVSGMVAKNALGRRVLRKLYVYKTAEHPHAAQKPSPVSL